MSWLDQFAQQMGGDAGRNPLIEAAMPARPVTSVAPAIPAQRSPDHDGWTPIGQGAQYHEDAPEAAHGVSYMIAPTDQMPTVDQGDALYRANMHRDSLTSMSEPQAGVDMVSGHVGSHAMAPKDRMRDEEKTAAALEMVEKRMERMLKRKEITLQKQRRSDEDFVEPTKHSVFVRIERGRDSPYHKISQADHDKAEANYVAHVEHQHDAIGARNAHYKPGYIASIVPKEMMAIDGAEGARLRSIEEHTHRMKTGKDFSDWMREHKPAEEHAYHSAMALGDIRSAIGDAHGWHNVPIEPSSF